MCRFLLLLLVLLHQTDNTVNDYYRDGSACQYVQKVSIPLLGINARDDPIAPGSAIPVDEFRRCKEAVLLSTNYGGHLGWFSRPYVPLCGTPKKWNDEAIAQFFDAVCRHKQPRRTWKPRLVSWAPSWGPMPATYGAVSQPNQAKWSVVSTVQRYAMRFLAGEHPTKHSTLAMFALTWCCVVVTLLLRQLQQICGGPFQDFPTRAPALGSRWFLWC